MTANTRVKVAAAKIVNLPSARLLKLDALAAGEEFRDPYPHMVASGALASGDAEALARDFPAIKEPGFFPDTLLTRRGAFDTLLRDLESPEIADILSEKLGLELRDKPRMITIRKWSAAKDGRIHNDGEAKICTALLYLNPTWGGGEQGGRLRVLRSETDFEDMALEVDPTYGSFFAFARTGNSWHGHKPFAGERRVIQVTWLRSWEDYHRKHRRGKLSFMLKKFLPGLPGGGY